MLEQAPRLNWAMLQKVKSTLHKDLVLHNEDHHPNHIVCFCSRFFLRALCITWDDPSVSKSLDGSPAEWRQKMLDEIPATSLQNGIPGVFANQASLPRGTVFLKRKKQLAEGRTIISYAQSLCSKLLEMASIALTVIAKTLYSDSRTATFNLPEKPWQISFAGQCRILETSSIRLFLPSIPGSPVRLAP